MLRRIRLELARTPEFPEGSHAHGYELVAPLTADGHLDTEAWQANRQIATVHRFWRGGEPDGPARAHPRRPLGHLVPARPRR